jgi:serine/threonine protein kinase
LARTKSCRWSAPAEWEKSFEFVIGSSIGTLRSRSSPRHWRPNPDRVARFEREAKTLAALNQPHIAQIYGPEESNGVRAPVIELVEGPTLADRIAQGPIRIDEALSLAIIASEQKIVDVGATAGHSAAHAIRVAVGCGASLRPVHA